MSGRKIEKQTNTVVGLVIIKYSCLYSTVFCNSATNLWWTVSPLRYHWQLCCGSGRHHRRWSTHCRAPSQQRRMWQEEWANPNQLWMCCSEVRWIWTSWHLLPCTLAGQADPQTHSGQDGMRKHKWYSSNNLLGPLALFWQSNPSWSLYVQWINSGQHVRAIHYKKLMLFSPITL